jgi:hypothetical protein
VDPDPGGPKTRGSGGSGLATLVIALNWARSLRWLNNVSGVYLIQVSLLLNGEQGLVDFLRYRPLLSIGLCKYYANARGKRQIQRQALLVQYKQQANEQLYSTSD